MVTVISDVIISGSDNVASGDHSNGLDHSDDHGRDQSWLVSVMLVMIITVMDMIVITVIMVIVVNTHCCDNFLLHISVLVIHTDLVMDCFCLLINVCLYHSK